MHFKRTAVRTIIASRNLASAAGQAKTAFISATAGPARSPDAANAIAPFSVLAGLKSFPKATRTSSALGISKQIAVIDLPGKSGVLRIGPLSMRAQCVPEDLLVPRGRPCASSSLAFPIAYRKS